MVAAVTYTATAAFGKPAKAVHAGANIAVFNRYVQDFHATVSSAVVVGKVPNRAIIVNALLNMAASASAPQYVLRADNTDITATLTGSGGIIRGTAAGPIKISLSDDAAIQHAVLRIEVTTGTTSATTSASLSGWVEYVMDSSDVI